MMRARVGNSRPPRYHIGCARDCMPEQGFYEERLPSVERDWEPPSDEPSIQKSTEVPSWLYQRIPRMGGL